MAEKPAGHILIECPNTIFHLYARDEGELSKIETFLRNIRGIKRLGLNDIYIWCNRQGILYVTKFHYRKDFSLWFNILLSVFFTEIPLSVCAVCGINICCYCV